MWYVVRRKGFLGGSKLVVTSKLRKGEISLYEGQKKYCQEYISGSVTTRLRKDTKKFTNDELTREANSLEMCPCNYYLKNKCICK